MSLTLDVAAFVAKAKKSPETVMRQTSFKLFSAIILGSPVDTGRFRMNWQISGPTPIKSITPGTDESGQKAIAEMSNFVLKNPNWNEFTLANNLPYANVIEYGGYPGDGPNTTGGYSKQAPQGVVRVNVKRFNILLAEEAAKIK